MNKLALAVGFAAAAAAAALVLSIFAGGSPGAPGFFGHGALIADVNLALEILLILGLTFGFWLARTGRIEAHRVNQTSWVLVNAALVIFMMASSMEDLKISSAAELADLRIAISWLHALVGGLTVASGIWLVLQMNDILPSVIHLRGWKTLMRCTLAGYWTVAVLGLAMYYLWYAAK